MENGFLTSQGEVKLLRTRVREIEQELEAMEKENERHKMMFVNMKSSMTN